MATTMPAEGTDAPVFDGKDQSGQAVSLRELKGRRVVLYFYPKDDTPGCTKQACNFRDNYGAIAETGALVLGASGDSGVSHRRFIDKYSLPFQLLTDEDHSIARAYGAWGLKTNYGKTYEGTIRSTFVIGPDGKIEKAWPKVKPDSHGAEVLAWLEGHSTP